MPRRSKLVTVESLPYRDADDTEQRHVFLYCRRCKGKFSAVQGDYFGAPVDYVFVCCGVPLVLARIVQTVEEI